MNSQAITIIRDKTSLPINAGMKYARPEMDSLSGIVAIFLGVTAIVPVLLVMFI